eukprot:UN20211
MTRYSCFPSKKCCYKNHRYLLKVRRCTWKESEALEGVGGLGRSLDSLRISVFRNKNIPNILHPIARFSKNTI